VLNPADRDVLLAEAARLATLRVEKLLADQPQRVEEMTLSAAGLTLDYAKQLIDDKALTALTAAGANLSAAFDSLISGDEVNNTECRPALHTLLRGTGRDAQSERYAEVSDTLNRMQAAVSAIHSGERRGASGQRFTDVINIGIGGSDLGPRMVCRALDSVSPELNTLFISNVTRTISMW